MKIVMQTSYPYKAFSLPEPVELEGFLTVITGKNGSGKTRLLESIQSNHLQIYIDDELLSPEKISLIDINSSSQFILTPHHLVDASKLLAAYVFKLIPDYLTSESLPEIIPFSFYPESRRENQEHYYLKKMVQNAEHLFKKEMHKLLHLEVEFSILLYKDVINSRAQRLQASLSELTVIYYQTLDKYEYLKFKITQDPRHNSPDEEIIKKFLSEESPPEIFNRIIDHLFRGKYVLSLPDIDRVQLGYTPNLTLKSSNEIINNADLSSGEKTIFWLAEKTFYATNISLSTTFEGKSLILIDEPDAHLHPQMVYDFYNCLINLNKELGVAFIFTTHSPTTIALCPNESIYNLSYDVTENNYRLFKTERDGSISQLLEGVSQISVNPRNCRQVYVENSNDSYIYERIYTSIKNRSTLINSDINLSFVSAGPKVADSELIKHIECVYGKSDSVKTLLERINGDSNCQQVIGMVEHLSSRGNKTVRGLIDWDNQQRQHDDKIVVFAQNYAYSIENIVYDPLSIYVYLITNDIRKPNHFLDVSEDFFWRDSLDNNEHIQTIIDKVTEELIGRPNNRDYNIEYMNNSIFKGDREYFIPQKGMNGHDFEKIIQKKYPAINRLISQTSGRPLIYNFTTKVTLSSLGWEFVNKTFETAFAQLQK